MPFPSSPRVVFRKNPLEQVICQLKFPTILEISSRDPVEFQNRVRERYPLYAKEGAPALPRELATIVAQLPVGVVPVGAFIHKFGTADAKHSISLTRDFVALENTQYSRWEAFRNELQLAKDALEAVYHPTFYSRVGLRYRDVIARSQLGLEGQPWHALVHPAMVGVLVDPEICQRVVSIQGQTLIRLDDDGGVINLQYGFANNPKGEQCYVIDVDYFTEQRLQPGDVLSTLDRFHFDAGNLFRWSITERLRNALEPTELEGA
jgi:uncharacterized protein (TIGR04255 family)